MSAHQSVFDPKTVFVHRMWILIAGCSFLIAGFIVGAGASQSDPKATGEYAVLQWFAKFRNPALDSIAKGLEFFGGPTFIQWFFLFFCLVLFLLKRRAMGLIGLAMVIGAWLPGHIAKIIFERPRPPAELTPIVVYNDSHSFPSGHTGFATALGIFLLFMVIRWGINRWPMTIIGISYILIMGLSRVYAGAHWPLDTVGGAALAGGMALILWWPAAHLWEVAQNKSGFWQENSGAENEVRVQSSRK